MKQNLWRILTLAVVAVVFTFTNNARAQYTETILHNFGGTGDGQGPAGNVTLGASGNLYGTAFGGGANSFYGAVYEISPSSSGWTESLLQSFGGLQADGYSPGEGVISDGAGNLYGTTSGGGSGNDGVVFELSPTGGGWTESVLYNFPSETSGVGPGNLAFDGSGNLYGTTYVAGANNLGSVFKLTPSGGSWTYSTIHSFTGGSDGSNPTGDLVFDAAGNLYGTATTGANTTTTICHGLGGCGTVFRMTPGAHWQFSTLYAFQGSRGGGPRGHLVFDSAGNIYGTTLMGGSCHSSVGCGTVFKLAPSTQGWKETVLHLFTGYYDGNGPFSGLTLDAAGNLFGATNAGGPPLLLCGTVFELTPVSGTWDFTVLTQFAGTGNGCRPSSGVILDRSGNLYGATGLGGTNGYGIAYELSPAASRIGK
jgi:uncharacterized repeat protein (TIGR03803 family)